MSSSGGGASLTSKLAELIVVANAGESSFVVSNDTQPALFIGTDSKVGVNTVTPTSQLSIVNDDGSCLSLHHGDSETAIANINVTSTGDLDLVSTAPGSSVKTSSSLDVVNHNGSSVGLKLGGQLVRATAAQLNATEVTPGTASANKALVLNGDKSVSGITSIAATSLSGTLQTAHQPNITSLGTLDSVQVTNGVTAASLTGTLQTAAQPNITSVGTLSSLAVTNGISAASLTGTLQTAAQPNITSVGALSSVSIAGSTIGVETAFLSGAVAGAASNSKVLVLSNAGAISGITSLSATNLSGTLQTAAQPNITSVGTLSSLAVTNGISAASLTGTLQTAAQPNITSVGALSSVSIAGSTIGVEAAFLAGASSGTAVASKALVADAQKGISGIGALSAATLTGVLQTTSQPNITSIGNLASVTIANSLIGSEAAFLSGAVAGSAAASKALVLNGSGAISGITSLSATSLSGTLQTAAQPNITSVGTLSSLGVSGSTMLSSTSDASGSTSGGALTISGGMAVAKKAYVGSDLYVSGNIFLKGVRMSASGGGGGSSDPNGYLEITTPGTAEASKALVLDSNSEIAGIAQVSTSALQVTGAPALDPVLTIPANGSSIAGICSVAWAPLLNIYIGVGSGGIFMSTDGSTWTSVTPPTGCPSTFTSVAYSPYRRIFVAVSNDTSTTVSVAYYVPSNNAWYTPPSATNTKLPFSYVFWSSTLSQFIAVAYNSASTSVVRTDYGYSWTAVGGTLTQKRWKSVLGVPIYGGDGQYTLICGDDGIRYTTNLIKSPSWSGPSGGAYSAALNSMSWSPELNVVIAVGNGVYRSTTSGYSWTTITNGIPTSTTFSNVLWISELSLFIATVATTTAGNTNRLYSSADGTSWAPYTIQLPTTSSWSSVCWSPEESKLVFVANSTTAADATKYALATFGPSKPSSITLSQIAPSVPIGINASNILQYKGTYHKWSSNVGTMDYMYLTNQGLGIGGLPTRQLEVISSNGKCLRLRNATNTTGCDFDVNGDGSLRLNGRLTLGEENEANSSSTTSGSLIVYGGAGISGALYAGSLNASSITGTLQTAAQNNITSVGTLTSLTVSGVATLSSATDATSTTTGAVKISGGVGIAKNLYIGGSTNLSSVTDATSSTAGGALTVSGGAAVAKNLYVGGTIYMNGTALTTGGSGGSSGGAATSLSIANWNSTVIGSDYLRFKNESTSTSYISQQLQAWSNTSYKGQAFSLNSLGRNCGVYFMLDNTATSSNYWQLYIENTSLSITNIQDSTTPQIHIPYTGTGVCFGKKTTSNTNHRVEVNGSMMIASTGDLREDLGTTPTLGIFYPEHTSGTEKDYIRLGPFGTGYTSAVSSFKIGTYYSGSMSSLTNYMYFQTLNASENTGGFRLSASGTCRFYGTINQLSGMSQQAHIDIMGFVNTSISEGQRLTSTGVVASSSASVPLSLFTKYSIASEQPIYALSDRRLKKEIEPINLDDAKRLLKVTPVTYMWKKQINGARRESGVIAQDLEDVGLEGLVGAIPNSELDDGFQRSVMYDRLTVYLLKLVQDQEARIAQLENELSK